VYRNSGGSPAASNWSVLKIDRANASVTQLATGVGQLSFASMGAALLYATEQASGGNRLITIAKAVPGTPQVLESSATTLASVNTSGGGIHQLWRRPAGAAAGTTAIEFINETGAKLFTTTGGGYPLAQVDASTLDLTTSESRTQFVFANGYGATGFSGAELRTLDAATATSVVLGSLPGAARYGSDPVIAAVTSTPMPFMAGATARVSSGSLQAADAATFSFDVRTPGSLRLTTTKQ
jgi:hypothetical protein